MHSMEAAGQQVGLPRKRSNRRLQFSMRVAQLWELRSGTTCQIRSAHCPRLRDLTLPPCCFRYRRWLSKEGAAGICRGLSRRRGGPFQKSVRYGYGMYGFAQAVWDMGCPSGVCTVCQGWFGRRPGVKFQLMSTHRASEMHTVDHAFAWLRDAVADSRAVARG